jgi:lysine 6-dehydrogenase
MTRVLLVGAGAVGGRAARQLVETPGVDELLVADARPKRAAQVAEIMGQGASTIDWQAGMPVPDGVDAIACAVPAGDDVTIVRSALEAGVACVTATDDTVAIQTLLELDGAAVEHGVPVVVGAGLAPGLSDVLVRHAADGLDTVDDVNVARWGAAGEASASTVRVALADRGAELHDGVVLPLAKRGGEELIWFPNPVDARGCEPVGNGLELLAHAVPELARGTIRFARAEKQGWSLPRRSDPVNEWGAIRVEVWGTRGAVREPVVYGAIERTEIAAGTVLALTAAALAGALPALVNARPGVHGLGRVVVPRAFLAELAARGVKVAVFEGVPVS